MSDNQRPTPETDAAIRRVTTASGASGLLQSKYEGPVIGYVEPDFARRLERERDEAREQLRQYDDAARRAADEKCTADEHHCACVPLLREKLRQANEAKQPASWVRCSERMPAADKSVLMLFAGTPETGPWCCVDAKRNRVLVLPDYWMEIPTMPTSLTKPQPPKETR